MLRPLVAWAGAAALGSFAAVAHADVGVGAAPESAPVIPSRAETLGAMELSVSAELVRDDENAAPMAFASFRRPGEGRVDVYKLNIIARAPTLDFLAVWVDQRLPGDEIAGGLHEHGGGLRAHTKKGKGLLLVTTGKGAYVVVVSPGKLLNTLIPDARSLAPLEVAPTIAATKGGVRFKPPPGFEPMPAGEAPHWAEVALWVPSLAMTPPQIWVHTARWADVSTEPAAAEEILRNELRAAGLNAALEHAPDPPLPVETLGTASAVVLRTETLNYDISAAYVTLSPEHALLVVLRTPRRKLGRYEGALRGILSTAMLPGEAGVTGPAPGAVLSAAPESVGGTHADPTPTSQRAIVALVLVIGLCLAAAAAWIYIRRRSRS